MSEKRKQDFVLRDSRLTELFSSNKDIQSAYNLCFSIFIILLATSVSYYLIDKNEFYSDLSWLKWCFGANQFHILCFSWLKMQMTTILILYPFIRIWLWIKAKSVLNSYQNSVLSLFSICYQIFLFWFGYNFVRNINISPVCSFALLCEQVRISMKVHSFIEENRHRKLVLAKDSIITFPTLRQLMYFLVAPTLLYRDTYVRTNRIHWKLVFWYFIQVFATIFVTFTISWRYIEHNYKWTGIQPFQTKQLIYLLLSGSLIGIQLCILMFYGLLHCWLNGFAEMLRFGDRQFYSDWWNCHEFASYYRKWNIVVHEWLRTYIFSTSLIYTNRGMAALSVFFVSAVIHEYILALSFGFFLPVLFSFFFILGVLLFFVAKITKQPNYRNKSNDSSNELKTKSGTTSLSLGNMFMFLAINIGWGLMVMLYSMEWYSRINCPTNDNSIISHLWPRFLKCVSII